MCLWRATYSSGREERFYWLHHQCGERLNLAFLCRKIQAALVRGLELAELNVAIVLELEGSTAQSVKRFEKALNRMRASDLPDRHVMIKMATVRAFSQGNRPFRS